MATQCGAKIHKWKANYTGYPAPMRQCYTNATYNTPNGPRCKRHTPEESRTKENLIRAARGA